MSTILAEDLPRPADKSMDSNIRVGVIGCGYWGPKLARNFNDLPGASLEMVADLREDRLEEIKQLYPATTVTRNYTDLLGDRIDAVVIATPVNTHYPLAKEALQAGKHVMIEKPITAHSDHAKNLIELASQKQLVLMVGHTFEYNPAVEAVRNIIQSGELGTIYYLNSVRVNLGLLQPDINVMWDLAPHDLSIIRFVLGQDPVKVSARGAIFVNKIRNLHEVAYINMHFPNGVMANLHLSWVDPVKQRTLTVVGSKKMLVYDDITENKVRLYDKGVDVPPYSITEEQFKASYRHGDEYDYPISWTEPLRAECSHFLECILTGATPRSDGVDGLKVLKILETAQRSLLNGGVELRVEY